jgi:DNA-binding transcriptional LysR family regulator
MRGVFLALVEEGHFGRAAVRLRVSPSALTERIERLERQVGVSLLVRNAAGLAGLTPAGARFAAQAAPLLAARQRAWRPWPPLRR